MLPVEEKMCRVNGLSFWDLDDGTRVVGVSSSNWKEFYKLLEEVSPTERLVVSPELVTVAGRDLKDVIQMRAEIESRVMNVLDFSCSRPETMFLLGTPLFVNPERPRNSALCIKNGEIVDSINKRCGVTREENECFEMVPEERPFVVPGTNTAVLICADFSLATLYSSQTGADLDRCLELGGKSQLIGQRVRFLPEFATSLLVIACWGVGGQWIVVGREDEYYEMQLRNIAWRLMNNTDINEIVMVDRVPGVEKTCLATSGPYNCKIKKII